MPSTNARVSNNELISKLLRQPLYSDNVKQNGNYYNGLYIIGVILGPI